MEQVDKFKEFKQNSIRSAFVFSGNINLDSKGKLIAVDFKDKIDFLPIRYFLIEFIPKVARGGHAHLFAKQLLILVEGEVLIEIFDGRNRSIIGLDYDSANAIYVPNGLYTILHPNNKAKVLVLSDYPFDEADYVRELEKFTVLKAWT